GSLAVLHAYDANNLSRELYNSNQAGSRDHFGNGEKFITPTVADGEVFVGTTNSVGVFGLLSPPHPGGNVSRGRAGGAGLGTDSPTAVHPRPEPGMGSGAPFGAGAAHPAVEAPVIASADPRFLPAATTALRQNETAPLRLTGGSPDWFTVTLAGWPAA